MYWSVLVRIYHTPCISYTVYIIHCVWHYTLPWPTSPPASSSLPASSRCSLWRDRWVSGEHYGEHYGVWWALWWTLWCLVNTPGSRRCCHVTRKEPSLSLSPCNMQRGIIIFITVIILLIMFQCLMQRDSKALLSSSSDDLCFLQRGSECGFVCFYDKLKCFQSEKSEQCQGSVSLKRIDVGFVRIYNRAGRLWVTES